MQGFNLSTLFYHRTLELKNLHLVFSVLRSAINQFLFNLNLFLLV
jgi:hypothetical protein